MWWDLSTAALRPPYCLCGGAMRGTPGCAPALHLLPVPVELRLRSCQPSVGARCGVACAGFAWVERAHALLAGRCAARTEAAPP